MSASRDSEKYRFETPRVMKSPSPSLDSAVSISSYARSRSSVTRGFRNGSSSGSSSRSSSPLRPGSFGGDPYLQYGKIRNRSESSSYENGSGNLGKYTGTIKVVIRPKPYPTEKIVSWKIHGDKVISHNDIGDFTFDHVFSTGCSNFDIYGKTTQPLIDRLIEGYNATIFAYGMTGSGKTFTMSGTEEEKGLIPLSVSYLFSSLLEKTNTENEKSEVWVSYLEIYNEKINDLLDVASGSNVQNTPSRLFTSTHTSSSGDLKIRDDSECGVRVVGLTQKRCDTSEEVLDWINKGNKNRKTSETEFNTRSSRSHAIVMIRLISKDIRTGEQNIRTLSLCDLAGSERGVGQNERRKEGAFINRSLLALGTVISRLSAENNGSHHTGRAANSQQSLASPNGSSSGNHIPYRDSKLTRLLQPALSGDSVVVALCTIDLAHESSSETLNTLRFASRSKNVALDVSRVYKRINRSAHPFSSPSKLDGGDDRSEQRIQELLIQLQTRDRELAKLREASAGVASGTMNGAQQNLHPDTQLLTKENLLLKNKLKHYESMLVEDGMGVSGASTRNTSNSSSSSTLVSSSPALDNKGRYVGTNSTGVDAELEEIAQLLPSEVAVMLETKFDNLRRQLQSAHRYSESLEKQLNDSHTETEQLKRSLQTKDKLIEALTSAKRLQQQQ